MTRMDVADPLERLDQLIAFVDWWFGDDPQPRTLTDLDVDAAVASLPFEVPTVLQRFYRAARRWPWARPFMFNQNNLLHPERLAASDHDAAMLAENGLLIFAWENQGVTWWACPPGGIDPAVYDREFEDDVGDAPHDFPAGRRSTSLVDFLIDYMLWELVINAERAYELTPLKRHVADHPAEREILHRGAIDEMAVGLWSDDVLYWGSRFALRPGADDKKLAPFAGSVEGVSLFWNYGDDSDKRERRRVSLRVDGDGSAELTCQAGRVKLFSHSLEEVAMPPDVHARLAPGLVDEEAQEGSEDWPKLLVRQESTSLIDEDRVLGSGPVNWDTARSFIEEVVDGVAEPSAGLVQERPFLTGSNPAGLPVLYRSSPELDADFVASEWTEALVDSEWSAGAGSLEFDGDGTVRSTSPRPRRGRWRVHDGTLFYDLGDDRVRWFETIEPNMTGVVVGLAYPFAEGKERLVRVRPGASEIPGVERHEPTPEERRLLDTTWQWSSDHTVTFLASGVARFDRKERPQPSWGHWVIDGDAAIFDVNHFTEYSVTIDGDTMSGHWYRVAKPDAEYPTSLTRSPAS